MSVTIRDAQNVEELATAVGVEIEVFAPDGRRLGRFTPDPRPGMMCPEFGMTDEEIERADNDPNAKWVTGEEVVARLRSLRGAS